MFNKKRKSVAHLALISFSLLCASAAYADEEGSLATPAANENSLATIKRLTKDASLEAARDSAPSAPKHSWADEGLLGTSVGTSRNVMKLFSSSANLLTAGVCGDSEPDPGEECDDGNTVSGDGCSATCTTESGFDCSSAIPGAFIENLLTNGGFETGVAPWTNTGTPNSPIVDLFSSGGSDFSYEQQGGGWFWSGGVPSASTTSATQVLTIPTNATTLTFNVWEGFCVPDNGAGDFVRVTIDGNEVYNSGICTSEAFYAQASIIDLATAPGGPYNDGASHTIAILGSMDFNTGDPQSGSIFVDNLSVNAPLVPPIPPTPSVCTAVVCGDGMFPQFSAVGTEECDDGNTTGGDGCSASCTVEQPNFICEDPEPAAASGEDIADGELEEGSPNPNWIETGTEFEPICSQVLCGAALANDGAFYAWFGGSSVPNDQTLTQDVVISSTATDLTFDLLVGICDSASDSLTVEIDGTEIYRYDCTADTDEYLTQSTSLGAFADGNVHTLQFIGHTEAVNAGNSNFFVDNISIEDNVAFAGVPGSCFELNPACETIEQFEGGIPAGWTVINLGPGPADGWGTSEDGICGSGNWSGGNVTGGSGEAACADSDATGQIEIDDGGSALEMDTYLCTPALDLSQVTDPAYSFLVNYQASDNDLNDNGTPSDTLDDFDDDFLRVLVGATPPNALSVGTYTELGNVFDHLDSTLALSEEQALTAALTAQNALSEAYVCFNYRGTYAWYAQIDNAGLRGSACGAPADGDSDGIPDIIDNCPNDPNPFQENFDGDSAGDACDPDDDNDGTPDGDDAFPFDPNEDTDTDGDGTGNNADTDDDNDGVLDVDDAFPLDPAEDTDTDGDGTGNNADTDDDNDGIPDGDDPSPLVPNIPPVADDQNVDTDEDIALDIMLTATDIDGPPLSFSVVSGPSHGGLTGTAPNLTYTPNADYNGADSFTFKANDGYLESGTATVSITVNPINDAPVMTGISLGAQDVQYSDAITDVIITATDIDSAAASMSLNFTGLPASLSTSETCVDDNTVPAGTGSTCSWTLSGFISVGAADYLITFAANDGDVDSNTVTTTVSVKHEDATVMMDTDNVVAVTVDSDGSDTSVTFDLSVVVYETQPDTVLAGPAAAGDISKAAITLQLVPVGPGSPVAPESCTTTDNGLSGYDEELTITCTFNDAPVNTYSLIATVGGDYYMGSGEDAVTVYDPSLGFASGGGWFYWPGTLDKTNFGFTMKYGKNGRKVKGSLLMIRHLADGTKYRVKSNALEGLALGDATDFGWASFSGKATYLEPGWDDPVGNYEFTAYVEDHNEPGTGLDSFWIEVRDKDRNVVDASSIATPAEDEAIEISGGNIVVPHGNNGNRKN